MATITVRALDVNGDPLRGNGQASFVSDIDAVAQIIGTRLKLFQAEWWENLNDGTPVFQQILGSGANPKKQQAAALILQQRISAAPYVISVDDVSVTFNRSARAFGFSCSVQTQFGTLNLSLPTPGGTAALNA